MACADRTPERNWIGYSMTNPRDFYQAVKELGRGGIAGDESMTRSMWWLVDLLSRGLAPVEREVALGDLAERGGTGRQALRDLLDLIVRRQAAMWKHPKPWLALLGLAVPLACLLNWSSRSTSYGNSVTIWLYANNWDLTLFEDAGFRSDLASNAAEVLLSFVTLACASWTSGVTLSALSQRSIFVTAVLFCLIPVIGLFMPHPHHPVHDAVFEVTFYRVFLPPFVVVLLVLAPSVLGMRQGFRVSRKITAAAFATVGLVAFSSWVDWRFPTFPRSAVWDGPIMQMLRVARCWPALYWVTSAMRRMSNERTI